MYIPATREERQAMLDRIGARDLGELLASIPETVRLPRPLALPEGVSEFEALERMSGLAAANTRFAAVFRGAGAYRHLIPAVVTHVTAREEFVTAYTPYQAEVSQGILQAIFEYQTMICELTGMDVSNASVYDGATAAAEAVAMCRESARPRVLVSAGAHPDVVAVVRTYCDAAGGTLELVPLDATGRTDAAALASRLGADVACVYVAQPNYFGVIEDAPALMAAAHAARAKGILGVNPIAMGILATPGECGADIAVGEGQPLGMPLSYGGPYVGFMACTSALMRKLPGRIVGETLDTEGKRAFVLTLQAREQHIRREKASSSICSNEALCALTASVYLTAMGPAGLAEAARGCVAGAHALAARMARLPGFELVHSAHFFHEFVTRCAVPAARIEAELAKRGILSGLPLSGEYEGCMLWCVTEANTPEQLDALVAALREVAA